MGILRDTLVPGTTAPITYNKYIGAGLKVLKTKTQRNNIPYLYRSLDSTETTMCFVSSDNSGRGAWYRLLNNPSSDSTADSDWEMIDFGVSQALVPVGEWDPNTNTPTLTDSSASGINGQFYFVINADSGVVVTNPALFGGATVTVHTGDWVVSAGSQFVLVTAGTVTWDSLTKPSVINDYVAGTVIHHTHPISDIVGLSTALDTKYDSGDLADYTAPFGSVPDGAIVDVQFLRAHYAISSAIVGTVIHNGNATTANAVTPSIDWGGTLTHDVDIDGASYDVNFGAISGVANFSASLATGEAFGMSSGLAGLYGATGSVVIDGSNSATVDHSTAVFNTSGNNALKVGLINGVSLRGIQMVTNGTTRMQVTNAGDWVVNVGSDATGDLYYRNSAGNFVRRAIGTSGQVLTTTGGIPVWATPITGLTSLNNGNGTVWNGSGTKVDLGGTLSSTITFDGNAGAYGVNYQNMGFYFLSAKGNSNISLDTTVDATLVVGGNIFNNLSYNAGSYFSNKAATTAAGIAIIGASGQGTVGSPSTQFSQISFSGGGASAAASMILSVHEPTSGGGITIKATTSAGARTIQVGNVITVNVGSDLDGDMYFRSSGAFSRLALGTAGQQIRSNGANPEWFTFAGMTNPMTTVGDMIIGGTVTGGVAAATRVGIGANNYVWTSNGTTASWQPAPGGGGGTIVSVSGTAGRITATGTTSIVIDIASTYVGQTSITTLGTIGTGTWQGNILSPLYGGTGMNNSTSTISLTGNLSFSGGAAVSFYQSVVSVTVTLPGASGTLATLANAETFTNKTLTSPQINGAKLETSSTIGYVWTATNTAGAGSWQVSAGGSGSTVFTMSPQSGNYTPVLGDANSVLIQMQSASNSTATIPPNSSAAYPIGTQLNFIWDGTGLPVFAPGAGVTLTPSAGAGIYSFPGQDVVVTLIKYATNSWYLMNGGAFPVIAANTILSGPVSGSPATPAFRTMVAADISTTGTASSFTYLKGDLSWALINALSDSTTGTGASILVDITAGTTKAIQFGAYPYGTILYAGRNYFASADNQAGQMVFSGSPGSVQAGGDVILVGGGTSFTNANGGNVILRGGAKNGTGIPGAVVFDGPSANINFGTTSTSFTAWKLNAASSVTNAGFEFNTQGQGVVEFNTQIAVYGNGALANGFFVVYIGTGAKATPQNQLSISAYSGGVILQHSRAAGTTGDLSIIASAGYSGAVAGAILKLFGGAAYATGNNNGGNVVIAGGAGNGTGHGGYILLSGLPTSASGLPTGALWNNSGVVNVAP